MRREAHLRQNELVKGEWNDESDLRDARFGVGGSGLVAGLARVALW